MRKLLVLFYLITSFTTLAQESLDQIKQKAITYSNEGQHEEALKYRLMQLKFEPTGLIHGHVGYELMSLNRDDEAKPYLEKATELNPTEPSHWINLSLIYSSKKEFATALNLIEIGFEANPEYKNGLAAKAKCLFRLNRFDESLDLLNKLLEAKYVHIDLLFTRAQILEEKNELDSAYADYTHGLTLNPEHYGILGGLAEVLQKQEKFEEEIIIRKRTLQLFIDNKENSDFISGTQALLGLAYSNAGDYKNALIAFNASIEIEASYSEVFIQRCITKIFLKDLEGACADLTEAMRLKPEDASAMRDFFEDEPDYKEFLDFCSPEL
jgi:tetratricopeptide (TPR) repeat protein